MPFIPTLQYVKHGRVAILNFTALYSVMQQTVIEYGRTGHVAQMGEKRNAYKFWLGSLKKRNNSDVDGMIFSRI
jgi:hypothetical protein